MSYLHTSMLMIKNLFVFLDGGVSILWVSALAIGIVIIVGIMMFSRIKARKPIPTFYKGIHIIATVIGAVIALYAAFAIDSRLWTNVILAVIIVALGLTMAWGKLKKSTAKTVLFVHAGIGITCYSIFVYYIITFTLA